LNRFAQAHFVREECALSEREVKHALPLIRKEGHERFMCGLPTLGDSKFVIATTRYTIMRYVPGGEPSRYFLRDTQNRKVGRFECCGEILRARIRRKLKTVIVEMRAKASGQFIPIAFDFEPVADEIGYHVDAGRRHTQPCGFELGTFSCAKLKDDRLDVLAGTETVSAKISASAGDLAIDDVANFDAIAEPARGMDFEIGKNQMSGVEVNDPRLLLAGAELAF
jgi:hypothetical protein